ncbi:MAG: (Fe-S)-binding protein, partial [Desulfovibrio sp.]|nr:(Fe-S)-binding protein [Desulfovibrio sp.]
MPPVDTKLVEDFTNRATSVNAVVQELPNMEAAMQYVIDVCEKKAPCEMLAEEPGTEKGPLGPNKVPTRLQKIIAAPALPEEQYVAL